MIITSTTNSKIKYLLKLKQKKFRDLNNEYLVEGEHLLKECYKSKTLKEIFLTTMPKDNIDIKVTLVTNEIMKKLSSLETPPKVIGLCHKNISNEIIGEKILLLDNIQDPGNLGTIIRSSKAFNIDTLVLSNDTVDLYNSKVLRATQGIYNYLNIVRMDLEKAISIIKEKNIPLYGTNVNNGISIKDINTTSYALIVGNEGNGVNTKYQELCDKNIYIPMNKGVESLNVSVATSIILYELGGK